MVFMFELQNLRGNFEKKISLIQSYRELNDVSFQNKSQIL